MRRWEDLRGMLRGRPLPLALIDMDALEINARHLAGLLHGTGKTMRIATKSVRVPAILQALLEIAPAAMRGLMTYSCEESHLLATRFGFDDILVAYPSVQATDLAQLAALTRAGKLVTIVCDCLEHLTALDATGRAAGVEMEACLEIDVSLRLLDGRVHLGPRRSPIRTPERVRELLSAARTLPNVRVTGIMAYEAQVAGLPDWTKSNPLMGPVHRAIKLASIPRLREFRSQVAAICAEEGVALRFFNGGGTGSIPSTGADPAVTEIAAGSGFFLPHLFDGFEHHRTLLPAALFALAVARRSDPGLITCSGGGYIASGPGGMDRLPVPFLPAGLTLTGIEGAGEVQTPLRVPPGAPSIALGDPILFRHAKAGELMERFNSVLLARGDAIACEEPTYRGLGWNFF